MKDLELNDDSDKADRMETVNNALQNILEVKSTTPVEKIEEENNEFIGFKGGKQLTVLEDGREFLTEQEGNISLFSVVECILAKEFVEEGKEIKTEGQEEDIKELDELQAEIRGIDVSKLNDEEYAEFIKKSDRIKELMNKIYDFHKLGESKEQAQQGQVPDETYEIADTIEEKIKDKDFVSKDDFDTIVEETIKEKEFVDYENFEPDLRGILSMRGWATNFNTGDLYNDIWAQEHADELEEACNKKEEILDLSINAGDIGSNNSTNLDLGGLAGLAGLLASEEPKECDKKLEEDKHSDLTAKYLPDMGDGENLAETLITAISRLEYRWYNDGEGVVIDDELYGQDWGGVGRNTKLLYAMEDILDGKVHFDGKTDFEDFIIGAKAYIDNLPEEKWEELEKIDSKELLDRYEYIEDDVRKFLDAYWQEDEEDEDWEEEEE